MRYNVRYCCSAGQILGTIEAQLGMRDGDRLPIEGFEWVNEPLKPLKVEYIEFRAVVLSLIPRREEVAVYSDDRPIEFWRKIATFREGDAV